MNLHLKLEKGNNEKKPYPKKKKNISETYGTFEFWMRTDDLKEKENVTIIRLKKNYTYNLLLIIYGIIMNSLDIILTFILLVFFGYREANPFWARYIYKNQFIVLLSYLPFICALIGNKIIIYVGIQDLGLIWKIFWIWLFFSLVIVVSYRTFINIKSLLALFKELVNLI